MGRIPVAQEYEALLVSFPYLRICDVDRAVTRRAVQLRADYNVHSVDALHLGNSLQQKATAFMTNDRVFLRANEQFDIVVLEDFTQRP